MFNSLKQSIKEIGDRNKAHNELNQWFNSLDLEFKQECFKFVQNSKSKKNNCSVCGVETPSNHTLCKQHYKERRSKK